MSVIEKAARRLEELRSAGIEVPSEAEQSLARAYHPNTAGATLATSRAPTGATPDSATGYVKVASSPASYFELELAKLAKDGFVTPDMPRSRIADEFRIVKRPLIANASAKRVQPLKNANLIMVTSAVPGEGKTFSAVNLAMSIATELDQTVLLVDADVARPSLPRVLGLPADKGLLDALQSKSFDLGRALIRTNVEKLTVLPSGTPHPNATELLASDAMVNLLHEMANRYTDRIIIFDSPPLLVTTEARVLATLMGQILFVVRAESTLQSDVKRALAAIEACPVKLVLLNQARTVAQGAYGYGYGYE
jgi:protein-tyrosine kinase